MVKASINAARILGFAGIAGLVVSAIFCELGSLAGEPGQFASITAWFRVCQVVTLVAGLWWLLAPRLALLQNSFATPPKKPRRGPYCGAPTPTPVPVRIS